MHRNSRKSNRQTIKSRRFSRFIHQKNSKKMMSKSIVSSVVLLLVCSFLINSYRLDALSASDDFNDLHELNDPFLIERLEKLLAEAGLSEKRSAVFRDSSILDGLLLQRLAMNRRPGLLRLKKDA